MKNKLLALATAMFILFSFTACSAEGTALLNEMKKVSEWEATEQTGTMNFEVKARGSNIKFVLDYTAYTIPEVLQMEMTVNPKSCLVDGKENDLTKGTYKLSPTKIYMDGLKMYISSAFIKEVCGILNESDIEVMDLSKDYIAFDMTDIYTQMGVDVKKLAKENANRFKELFSELEKADIAVNIKQEGRKYTVELLTEKMISNGLKLSPKTFKMLKNILSKDYKKTKITDEQIKEAMNKIEAYGVDKMAGVSNKINSSTAKYVIEYTDDIQKTEITYDTKISVKQEKIDVKFTMTDNAKKATKKEVKMPTSVKAYTMDEIMNLATAKAKEEVAAVETKDAKDETTKLDAKTEKVATKAA